MYKVVSARRPGRTRRLSVSVPSEEHWQVTGRVPSSRARVGVLCHASSLNSEASGLRPEDGGDTVRAYATATPRAGRAWLSMMGKI